MEGGNRNIISEKQAYGKMAHLCSQREYCRFDIRKKLQRMMLSEDAICRIISRLEKEKFIDENRYAHSFINDKLRFSKWGKNKILFALRQKNICDEVINEAFSEFSETVFIDSLKTVLEKKLKTVKAPSHYQTRAKLIRFALGKGFPMNAILQCLNSLQMNAPDDDFS